MKNTQSRMGALALAAAMALPASLMAADAGKDEHTTHHPDQAQQATAPAETADPSQMQALRERMQEIRQTPDPDKRMQLMEAQMDRMENMSKQMESCMMNRGGMAGGQPGGMMGGMMGPGMGMGMMGGKGMMGGGQQGMGMMGGKGMMDHGQTGCPKHQNQGMDDMMERRMDMMEKRMDMMQMMMQMRMR